MIRWLLLLGTLSAVAAGCAMDFRPGSLVPRARLVGVRVRIESSPERALPLLGESFAAEPIVVASEGATPLTTSWFACAQLPSRTGTPECSGTPLAAGASMLGMAPPMTVVVPPGLAPGSAILFAIASCDGGALPRLPDAMDSAILPTCEGGAPDARAELSIFSVSIATDEGTANRHPSLSDETTTLRAPDDRVRAWDPPPALVPAGCAALPDEASLPHLAVPPLPAEGERDEDAATWIFGITSQPDDRERYIRIVPGGQPPVETREVLQISHYTTAGTYERQFSAVEGDADLDGPSEIGWLLPVPDDVPPDGLAVRVWWVARDLRGGVAFTERALCVTRAP